MIFSTINDEKETNFFFSNKFPQGKLLPIKGSLSFGVRGYIGIEGMGVYSEVINSTISVTSESGIHLLDLETAMVIPVKNEWSFIKDYGWRHDNLQIDSKLRNYFITHIHEYLDKIIFMTPKKKIIFKDAKFYELTEKDIKEMGGWEY